MNASHVAGGGLGAIVGSVIVALGARIGLDLTNFDSAVLGTAAIVVGVGLFHVVGKAWTGAGVFPSLKRGLFGPTKPAAPPAPKPVAAAPPPPPAPTTTV